jgi:hypothetical protein
MRVKRHGLARFKADEHSGSCIPDMELLRYKIFFRKLCILKKMDGFHNKTSV